MRRPRIIPSLVLPALMLAGCTMPESETPAPPAPEPQPVYKKPPRMNGRGKITSISFEDFFALQQSGKAMIFDARPAFIYQLGHIPGAIHLPKDNCDTQIHSREESIKSALADGKTLVTYCSGPGCPDARTVAIHISGFGYPVSVFHGGWSAWKDAEMPAE
jgi:rhodanese-related sulfurtransferase